MTTLTPTKKQINPRTAFVAVTVATSAILVAWASIAKVDVIVRTEGRIVPAGKSQIIQHLEGGIVRNILVHEGQKVVADQVLLELSDVQVKSNLDQEQSKSTTLRGREARLIAESSGSAGISFPKEITDQDVRRAETLAFEARRARVADEVRVLHDQNAQKRGEISEAESRRKNLASELEVAQQQYKVIENLKRNGAASNLELLDSQSRVQRLTSQIAEAEAVVPRLKAAMSETESKVGEVWARYRAEASSELTQLRGEIEKSGFEIDTNKDKLDRNQVKAPVAGIINRMSVTTVGGVIRPGEALMEITPADQSVLIEARAKPNDRANLRHGLPAHIRFGAYDYATFGTLTGKVSDVSADTLTDEREGRYYRVMLEAKDNHQGMEIVPGMTAVADVVVGKRTVISYLLSPLLRFSDRALRDPR